MSKIKRKPLDFATRYAALRRTNGFCPYCDAPLQFEYEFGAKIAYDHMIPLARGGADEAHNLIACCHTCNAAKHTKTTFEFLCERMGIQLHWFAKCNVELDGVSAEVDDTDFVFDTDAWRASCEDGDGIGGDEHAIEFDLADYFASLDPELPPNDDDSVELEEPL